MARCLFTIILIGLINSPWANGQETPLLSRDSHLQLVQRAEQGLHQSYERGLAFYRQRLEQAPFNVVTWLEQCRFIGRYVYLDDFDLDLNESDLDQCEDSVAERFPEHPELLLYRLENTYSEEGLSAAEDWAAGVALSWTEQQQAQLHRIIAERYQGYPLYDEARWAEHTYRSYQLSKQADTVPGAARHLLYDGQPVAALELIEQNMLSTTAAAYEKLLIYLDQGDVEAALAELAIIDTDETFYLDRSVLAEQLATAGALDPARAQLEAAANDWNIESHQRSRLDFEQRWGSAESQLQAYQQLRDLGFAQDPYLRDRLALALEHPQLRWRDLAGLAGLLALLLFALLLPGLWILPIHYRGLLRARRGLAPTWPGPAPCNLRDAWWLSAAYVALVLIMVLVMDHATLRDLWHDSTSEQPIQAATFAHWIVWQTLLFALLAAAFIPRLGWRTLGKPQLSWGKMSGLVVVSVLGLWVIAYACNAVLSIEQFDWQTIGLLQSQGEMMLALYQTYGPWPMLLLIGGLAPIAEEVAFRGVLLNGFCKHISFTWANLAQSSLFALLHDLTLFPFFLAFGTIAGYLHKRSGGLAAPMALHLVNNTAVAGVVIWVLVRINA